MVPADIHWLAFKRAVVTYTRIPLKVDWQTQVAPQWSLAYLPWVGLVVGLISALPLLVDSWSESLQALLMILIAMLVTGAFHEDGLLDSADGLWGGWTVSQRLEIMKDSRVGSFGVLAAWGVLSLKWWLLSEWLRVGQWEQGLWTVFAGWLAVHMGARLLPLFLIQTLSYVTTEGSKSAAWISKLSWAQVPITGAAIVVLLLLTGVISTIFMAFSLGVLFVVFGWYVKRKLGGYNGDILGASEQLAEVVILFALLGWSA
ncbi:adenosylcobinamide-GDP ribazoletransferase [Maribrevibacterium harenarium]|uniref:Adenosylcobinamide-GDP ribazoletransferase n=1 Tax=Maribrevibacterium harenarium TaxID=2589817 RepID=A0A501X1Y3_9GAMM|nr:adenosylcobinamide-GDP ribazoletransferase [Maribrevibacterium harenarium]TPE54489.1 adenosylcobinamide-GDP ribazoletransferase [Maribrevibacterium harenarium]